MKIDLSSGITGGIAGAVITIVITYLLVDIPVLKSNVSDLRDNQKDVTHQIVQIKLDIIGIDKKYVRIAQFLSDKLHFNFTEFVELSDKKGVSSTEFQKATAMLEKNSPDVESYLMKNLSFTPAEIQALRSPSPQSKK